MVDVFERLKAALGGRYALEHQIGAGGMATVYAARDLQHDRRVAVKVLRPEVAAVLGSERFLQEIRVTAALQHPHILPLFDSGEADGFLYYVMPLVEGESLRQRLERERQLPVEDALDIAHQVANALAYAHSRGLVHRDIKPENILLSTGQATVADFGIARAINAAGGNRLTETGLAVGTPVYMSPEQASGERELDGRSDIYSLASVLYETLAGEPPYTGPTTQAITARKLSESVPPLRARRNTVTPAIEEAIAKALAHVPADRFSTALQFSDALRRAKSAVAAVPAHASPTSVLGRRLSVPVWAVALVILGIIGAAGLVARRGLSARPEPAATTRAYLTIPLSPGEQISGRSGTRVGLSPDARHAVWMSAYRGPALRLRRLDAPEVTMTGDEGASHPFFSPDGRWIGYFSDGRLRRMPLAGGPAITIAPAAGEIRGATWGPGDLVVFASGAHPGLMVTPVAGGEPRVLTRPDSAAGELDHRWPEALPNGSAVLFTVWTGAVESARVAVASLASGAVKLLAERGTSPRYVARTGHVVYAQPDGSLLAAPFDVRRLEVTGPAVPVMDGVSVNEGGVAEFALARDGTLLFFGGQQRAPRSLVAVDRVGDPTPLIESRDNYLEPRISPDGTRIAAALGVGASYDIWIFDLSADTRHRITHGGYNRRPEWSPDGGSIAFSSGRPGVASPGEQRKLFIAAPNASTPARLLLETDGEVREMSWASPADMFVFSQNVPGDVGIASSSPSLQWRLIIDGPFNERQPHVSSDGQWLAYVSDESGRDEVYVADLPAGRPRWQVSTDGGAQPRWSPTGRELFYRAGDRLIAATVAMQPTFRVRMRRALFDVSGYTSYYDVFPSGDRFLMSTSEGSPQELVVVLNWLDALPAARRGR